jgi:hypothetical protein
VFVFVFVSVFVSVPSTQRLYFEIFPMLPSSIIESSLEPNLKKYISI